MCQCTGEGKGDLKGERCIGEEESVLSRLTIIGKLWGERERERERERGERWWKEGIIISHTCMHHCG